MSALVESTRKYIGTPFRHRGRSSKSLDCAGLIIHAAADIGVDFQDIKHYGREPFNDGLVDAASKNLGRPLATGPLPANLLIPGDILLVRFDTQPHHIALVADHPLGGLSMIHASADVSQQGKVVEHRLDEMWIRRITHVFRPGL